MSLTFTTSKLFADRLSRLPLACSEESGPLGQVSLSISSSTIRFAATNGRLLASLVQTNDGLDLEPAEMILDREQLLSALKVTSKASGGLITWAIGTQEARLTCGSASAIVRRVQGAFPRIEHAWTRPAGRQWLPSLCSLDTNLLSIAQKISGHKRPLLYVSPVDPAGCLHRVWDVPGAHAQEGVDLAHLRAAVTAPAYWTDHELAILVMPIARAVEAREPDLGRHVMSLASMVAAAA